MVSGKYTCQFWPAGNARMLPSQVNRGNTNVIQFESKRGGDLGETDKRERQTERRRGM